MKTSTPTLDSSVLSDAIRTLGEAITAVRLDATKRDRSAFPTQLIVNKTTTPDESSSRLPAISKPITVTVAGSMPRVNAIDLMIARLASSVTWAMEVNPSKARDDETRNVVPAGGGDGEGGVGCGGGGEGKTGRLEYLAVMSPYKISTAPMPPTQSAGGALLVSVVAATKLPKSGAPTSNGVYLLMRSMKQVCSARAGALYGCSGMPPMVGSARLPVQSIGMFRVASVFTGQPA